MPSSAIASCRRWRSPGAKRWVGRTNRIACRFHTIKERRICCDSTFDSWRYHCSETGNYRPSNSGSQRHKEPPSSPHSCRGGIMFSDIPRSKSSFTSHPSRVYASPPWRRSTTVGGLLSHPPCLAALWRRWWSGRANSSQTGNCPGCRFSFPSMCWAWVGLRQRASSGKTTPQSAVEERWNLWY